MERDQDRPIVPVFPPANRGIQAAQYYPVFGLCGEFGSPKIVFRKMESRLDQYEGPLVFICDGASWIWNWVEDAYREAVQILDYFHSMEYLRGFADLYYSDPHEKTQWVNKMEDLLNTDGINEVIEAHQTIKAAGDPMIADTKEKLDALLSYYKNNRNRMNYGRYKKTGYLVGSGPIESANRNV